MILFLNIYYEIAYYKGIQSVLSGLSWVKVG